MEDTIREVFNQMPDAKCQPKETIEGQPQILDKP